MSVAAGVPGPHQGDDQAKGAGGISRESTGSTNADSSAEADKAPLEEEVHTSDRSLGQHVRLRILLLGPTAAAERLQSVPQPEEDIVQEHVVEAAPSSRPSQTLIQLLETEANPSRSQVLKVAFAEGDAHEDSNLMDVLGAPDSNGWPPLLIAAQRKQADAVAALLELGAAVDCRDPSSGWTPLMYAVANGNEPVARILLKHGASVNAFAKPSDWNALCVAIMSSRTRFVEMLFDAGADLELIKRRHPTLAETYMAEASQLRLCGATSKRCQVCKLVSCRGSVRSVGCGAALERSSSCEWPALITAAQRMRASEVDSLLEQGADVECHDPTSGWTPLMYAVANGNMVIVKRLLAHGASPDTLARPSCWNALCVALLSHRWEVADLLLDHNADLDAVQRSHPDILEFCAAQATARAHAAAERKAHRGTSQGSPK
eukprot:CAMPEP_0179144714 /NCGR_PEP_ID=MMETSP0796-20121207/69748_1 /TAXON_ID=73915 /ORGANISM="Pyrodinium bahamense, Strain pbaha01" /LENGTH=432 /DNA_ID=CAMNT_0020844985 /DNA_START=1 /DNA_END=1297 /DNA_ORIENTATION=-